MLVSTTFAFLPLFLLSYTLLVGHPDLTLLTLINAFLLDSAKDMWDGTNFLSQAAETDITKKYLILSVLAKR